MSETLKTSQSIKTEEYASEKQIEQLGLDTSTAHSAALREYRNRDYDDYRDHVYELADAESNGAGETGDYFTRLNKREDLKSDIKEYTDEKRAAAKAFGAKAIHFATTVKAGLMPSLDNYRLVRQMNRGYRQNQIERPTRESSTPPELIDANATRLDVLKSKTIVPIRTLGKKALDLLDGIYTAGLERNDPAAALVHKEAVQSKRQEAFEKAEALRQERAENLQAERKLAEEQAAAEQHDRHIEDVMNQVDLSKNTNPRILELMNGRFYPDNYMRDETATILYSRIFSESKNSDKNYLVAYHTLDDGELLPLLMRAGKDNQWAIDTSVLPESLIKLLPSEETLDKLIESISSQSGEKAQLNPGETEHLIDRLRLKPKDKPKQEEPKSNFAIRREKLQAQAEQDSKWENSRYQIAKRAREEQNRLRKQRERNEQKAA